MLPLLPETPLDCAAISSTDLVELVAAAERLAAQACAVQAAAMAELARRPVYEGGTLERPATDRGEAADLVAAEVGAACRWSRMMAQHRVRLAIDLAERLPATLAALAAGTIDLGRARAVAEATLLLDRPAAAAVEGRVLDGAADQTVSQLKVALRRAVIAVDPLAAAARHEAAVAARRVEVRPLDDGVAELAAPLRADHAQAAYQRLTEIAKDALRACRESASDSCSDHDSTLEFGAVNGGEATLDALRADALVWLVLGEPMPGLGAPPDPAGARGASADAPTRDVEHTSADGCGHCGGRRRAPLVQIVVPVGTLLGVTDEPGHLAGYGPIPAPLARQLSADERWRRILTDPVTGAPLASESRSYEPPAGTANFVRARDGSCRFPGCRQPASRNDLDHVRPWPHGPTSTGNLCALCRFHHRLKTHHGWRLGLDPHTAEATWTSPLGRRRTTMPDGLPPVGWTSPIEGLPPVDGLSPVDGLPPVDGLSDAGTPLASVRPRQVIGRCSPSGVVAMRRLCATMTLSGQAPDALARGRTRPSTANNSNAR
jgi:hypothetical protein